MKKSLFTSLLLLTCCFVNLSGNVFASGIISQPDVRKYNLALGKNVFQRKCIECHSDMDSVAPQLGKVQDWEQRISIPVDTLISHALHGHGEMPPRGGFDELSDREVSAAVAYVVDQGRRIVIRSSGDAYLDEADFCTKNSSSQYCTASQVDNSVLLHMLWIITGQDQEI